MFVCLLIYLLLFSSLFRFLFIFLSDVFSSGIWSSLSSRRDPSLQESAYKLSSTVLVAKAPGTIDSYRRAFARWKEFATAKEEIEAFPAKTEHVALYLQHLLDSTQSYSVVDSAIYAIQWAHNLAGLPSPVDAPIIHDISKAAKKMNGVHVVNRKQAVTADMIGTFVSASNLSNFLELSNVCIFVLAFEGFFRINEVLHIKYIPRLRLSSVPELSLILSEVTEHVFQNNGHLLRDLNQPWLQPQYLEEFPNAIHQKGAALDNCWGFVDGTVGPISRPGENQRVMYNRHKRVHAIKFQSVVSPNGLIANLYGPVSKFIFSRIEFGT